MIARLTSSKCQLIQLAVEKQCLQARRPQTLSFSSLEAPMDPPTRSIQAIDLHTGHEVVQRPVALKGTGERHPSACPLGQWSC